MLEKLIELIFPTSCAICGKLYKKTICPICYRSLKPEIKTKKINEENFNLYFISFYEGKIKKLILQFKFKEKAYLNELFTELIIRDNKLKNIIEEYDFIVPVPMYKLNKISRGYNQTELIASKLENKLKIKKLVCLEKIKQNKKQSLLSEKERKTNIINVYKLVNKNIANKKVLLIDDIYTTGSTAKECIKELQKGKPKKADVLVISKSKKG